MIIENRATFIHSILCGQINQIFFLFKLSLDHIKTMSFFYQRAICYLIKLIFLVLVANWVYQDISSA